MRQLEAARPGPWRGAGRAGNRGGNGTLALWYSSTGGDSCQDKEHPVALEVFKRDDWLIVGKCSFLDDQRIFAVAHDQQKGVDTTISIPEVALDFADRWGCRWLYFWRSKTLEVRRLAFHEILRRGWWGPGAGRERYIPLADMELIGTWARPKWEWAEERLQLATPEPDNPGEPQGRQLSFDALLAGVSP